MQIRKLKFCILKRINALKNNSVVLNIISKEATIKPIHIYIDK